ncbi:PREDICTED: chymotrypsinogen B2-like [Condylura cristata]|uniref:chymotrypsinogen B2-like n=1 Tax=Condylura cristata TaxID=143302 RepID=UPI0003343794|nr:PREDICTED: chymotrypsinogen B2-like [Condylura cristata]
MAFVWLLSCFTLIGVSVGSGTPPSDPELVITPRIINGSNALPGAWPWHVSLATSTGRFKCGGSLIDRFWVITAAHCNVTISDRVVTGFFDVNVPDHFVEVLSIAQVFIHPKFDLTTVYSDIALLKLDTPARFHHSVSPVLLPSVGAHFPSGTWCKIMGWGYLHPNGTGRPVVLQQATVYLHPIATCRKFWPAFKTDSMICAGYKGVSFSRGDSGGSLVCRKRGTWILVGILSFFAKNHPTRMPFVVTRVPTFIPWIEEIMAHN